MTKHNQPKLDLPQRLCMNGQCRKMFRPHRKFITFCPNCRPEKRPRTSKQEDSVVPTAIHWRNKGPKNE